MILQKDIWSDKVISGTKKSWFCVQTGRCSDMQRCPVFVIQFRALLLILVMHGHLKQLELTKSNITVGFMVLHFQVLVVGHSEKTGKIHPWTEKHLKTQILVYYYGAVNLEASSWLSNQLWNCGFGVGGPHFFLLGVVKMTSVNFCETLSSAQENGDAEQRLFCCKFILCFRST